MSSLGPLTFGKKDEQIFLGREINQHRDYSEETAIKIDEEVRRIIAEQYEHAREIINTHSDALVRIAEALLELETLDGKQIRKVAAGEALDEDEDKNNRSSDDEDGSESETNENPFKKPILPPITGNNPATA
jgi:cell division protease FtsH